MTISIKKHLLAALLPACLGMQTATASHIVGGSFTYQYLGDTVISGVAAQKYEVTLFIYQDCVTGVPDAIDQDNPAFFTFYATGDQLPAFYDTSVFYDPKPGSGGAVTLPPESMNTPCGFISSADMPALCLLRKKFTKTYYLPASVTGYTVVYQRCCRNSTLFNIVAPGDEGITFYCNIPPATTKNSCATFTSYPPQVTCLNTPMIFDHAATDADGDSLTYELAPAYVGATDADIKPVVASAPPFDVVTYFPPHTFEAPVPAYPALEINTLTGKLTGTPNRIGRYLLNIACKEWRNGVLINTVAREFQLVVTDCDKLAPTFSPEAGPDQTVLVGARIQFEARGGKRYLWNPATYLSNPYIADPVGEFTKAGEFTYVLVGESDSGCTGSDTLKVTVLDHSDFVVPNAFTPNNDGRNDVLIPIPVAGSTLRKFRLYNRWGNLVYETATPGVGWDGTNKGTLQSSGIYAWSIEFTDNTGQPRVKGGSVILLR